MGRDYASWNTLINRSVDFLVNNSEDAVIRGSDNSKWRIFLNQFCHILKAVEEYSPREKLKDTEIVLIKPLEGAADINHDLSNVSPPLHNV